MELPWEDFEKEMLESYIKSLNDYADKKEMFRIQRRNLDPKKDKKEYHKMFEEMTKKMNDDEEALYNKNIEVVYTKLGFDGDMFDSYIEHHMKEDPKKEEFMHSLTILA